jgi:hypothetical protein
MNGPSWLGHTSVGGGRGIRNYTNFILLSTKIKADSHGYKKKPNFDIYYYNWHEIKCSILIHIIAVVNKKPIYT